MINDIHCHFFSSRFLELLAPDTGGAEEIASRLQWDAPGTPTELGDRWIADLDRHGVARASLIASIPGDAVSVAEAVAHHPHRFVGFFMHNPTGLDSGAALERSLKEYPMHAVCLFPAMHGYRLDDECVERVFRAAADHGAAVFAHCGVLTVGVRKKLGLPSPFDIRYGNPLDLHASALKYPQLPIIIPHFGAGLFREALMVADLCPNVLLDTSSSNGWIKYVGLSLADVFRRALAVTGPERLLFGSDSSFFPRGWVRDVHEQQSAALDEIGASSDSREKIFAGNFERLFPPAHQR